MAVNNIPLSSDCGDSGLGFVFVLGDGGDDEGGAEFAEHFALGNFDDAGVGTQEFAVGQRVAEGFAPDNGGAHVNAAFKDRFARTVAKRSCATRAHE